VPAAGGYDVQLLKFPASYRVARAIVAAAGVRWEQGFTTIRDVETEGAGYGTSESNRRSTRATFRARECSYRPARSRRPAATCWKGMRPNSWCRKERS